MEEAERTREGEEKNQRSMHRVGVFLMLSRLREHGELERGSKRSNGL